MEEADRCTDTHTQRERETFAFSQPGDRGLPFDVFGRWQPLMRISMAAEWLWLQIELAELHLPRSTQAGEKLPTQEYSRLTRCVVGAKVKVLIPTF